MGGRGVPRFLLALGRFSAGKGGERRVCGVLTLVENNTSAVVDGLEPAAFRRNPSSRVTWCLLRTRPAFVLVCEDHLCHETEFLYEALVAMLRACIVLRHRTFPRQRQGWRLRSSHTEQKGYFSQKHFTRVPFVTNSASVAILFLVENPRLRFKVCHL